MTVLAGLVRSFAALLTPADGNAERLNAWIAEARTADLPSDLVLVIRLPAGIFSG